MTIPYHELPSVKNPTIDEQHARWIEIANRLSEAVERGQGDEVIGATLSELADFSASHFASEEYLMTRCVHDRLMSEEAVVAHSQAHAAIMDELGRLVYEFEFLKGAVTRDTVAFIRRWYSDHVEDHDSALAATIHTLK